MLLNIWTGLLATQNRPRGNKKREEAAAAFFPKSLAGPCKLLALSHPLSPFLHAKLLDSEAAPDHLATTRLLWTWTSPCKEFDVWHSTHLPTHSSTPTQCNVFQNPRKTSVTPSLSPGRRWDVLFIGGCICVRRVKNPWAQFDSELSFLHWGFLFIYLFYYYLFSCAPFTDGKEMTAKCHATHNCINIHTHLYCLKYPAIVFLCNVNAVEKDCN